MKVCTHDNRGNGAPLFAALKQAGHDIRRDHGDVLLTDSDHRIAPFDWLCDSHDRVFLHPHGAGFVGSWPRHPHTRGQFVTAEGHQEMLYRTRYTGMSHAIGWHFCELREFQHDRMAEGMRVTLAPTHAMGDGWIEPWVPFVTQLLHLWLSELPVQLTVRYVHGLNALGITPKPNVEYVEGNGMVQDAVDSLEKADLVIGGAWTYPTLAVARGIPTIMYGAGPIDKRIEDYVRFPLTADSIDTSDDLWHLMHLASHEQESVRQWRERFIGKPFDPTDFVRKFERAVKEW